MKLIFITGIIVFSFLFGGENDFISYTLDQQFYASDTVRTKKGVKLYVIDFMTLYCKPCREALPEWKNLYEKYSKKGLEIAVIALPSEKSKAKTERKDLKELFVKESPNYTVLYDIYYEVGKQFGAAEGEESINISVPKIILMDNTGKTIKKSESFDEIKKEIEKRLR